MGIVVRFPRRRRHARTSKASLRVLDFRDARSASVSKLTPRQSRSPANRTTADQWLAGMPRVRQPLTVESSWPSHEATAPVPPRSLMMESQVSMGGIIVRDLRTSQGFANCETTFVVGCVPMRTAMDNENAIIRRLIAVRKHIAGDLNQQEFARSIGLEKNIYNPFEKGKRPLTLDAARRIRRRWGVSVDWLLFGDFGLDQREALLKIGPEPDLREQSAAKPEPKRKRA